MKYILPHGGYGLGNDLIPWAKGYILAKELGATLLHPAWGNNPRGYHKYFRSFRYDYQLYRLFLRTLPRYRFSEDDYRKIGINDFAESSKAFAKERGLNARQHYILEVTGFWGGFSGLETARDYILSRLYNTAYTQENLFTINNIIQKNKLVIGVHVRLSDFRPAGQYDYSGVEQSSISLAWYHRLCDLLEASLGSENIQFIICSDGTPDQLQGLVDRESALFASELPNSDISDLLVLKKSDMLICSISSYSMWAAFLSNAPYAWYRPNLVSLNGRVVNHFIRSLGVYGGNQERLDVSGRGVAMDLEEPLPTYLIDQLRILLNNKQVSYDLVRGGSAT